MCPPHTKATLFLLRSRVTRSGSFGNHCQSMHIGQGTDSPRGPARAAGGPQHGHLATIGAGVANAPPTPNPQRPRHRTSFREIVARANAGSLLSQVARQAVVPRWLLLPGSCTGCSKQLAALRGECPQICGARTEASRELTTRGGSETTEMRAVCSREGRPTRALSKLRVFVADGQETKAPRSWLNESVRRRPESSRGLPKQGSSRGLPVGIRFGNTRHHPIRRPNVDSNPPPTLCVCAHNAAVVRWHTCSDQSASFRRQSWPRSASAAFVGVALNHSARPARYDRHTWSIPGQLFGTSLIELGAQIRSTPPMLGPSAECV